MCKKRSRGIFENYPTAPTNAQPEGYFRQGLKIMTEKFRVVFIPAIEVGGKAHSTSEFDTLAEANAVKNAIADYTLFPHDNVLMPDYSNTGWVEQFIDGEWEEVEDD